MKALSCEIVVYGRNKIRSLWLQHSEWGGFEAGGNRQGKTTPAPKGRNPHTEHYQL